MHMPGGTLENFLGQHASLTVHPDGTPIPIMVLTGEGRSEVRQQALADGAAIVLQKPVDPRIWPNKCVLFARQVEIVNRCVDACSVTSYCDSVCHVPVAETWFMAVIQPGRDESPWQLNS